MGNTEKGVALFIVTDSIPVVQNQPEAARLGRCVSSGAETRDECGAVAMFSSPVESWAAARTGDEHDAPTVGLSISHISPLRGASCQR